MPDPPPPTGRSTTAAAAAAPAALDDLTEEQVFNTKKRRYHLAEDVSLPSSALPLECSQGLTSGWMHTTADRELAWRAVAARAFA